MRHLLWWERPLLGIVLRIHERICEFSSPSLYPLSPRNRHGIRMGLVRRKKEEMQQMEKGEGMG